MTSDPKVIGNTLNRFSVATIEHNLASDIPEAVGSYYDYSDTPLTNTFYFNPIIPFDVKSQILNLPNNKAH